MTVQIRRFCVPAITATLAVAVLAVVVLNAGEAEAHHVGCGDTITPDTTLDGDLVDCPDNGIVIGATTSPSISTGTRSTETAS